jgi:phosphate uptake regulator
MKRTAVTNRDYVERFNHPLIKLVVETCLAAPMSIVPTDKLESVIEECMNIYFDFIQERLGEIADKRIASQFLILKNRPTLEYFNRFEELGNYVSQAHNDFFEFNSQVAV